MNIFVGAAEVLLNIKNFLKECKVDYNGMDLLPDCTGFYDLVYLLGAFKCFTLFYVFSFVHHIMIVREYLFRCHKTLVGYFL